MPRFLFQKELYTVEDRGDQGVAVWQEGQEEQLVQLRLEPLAPGQFLLKTSDGQQKPFSAYRQGEQIQIWYQGEYFELKALARQGGEQEGPADNQILAPLTGKVIEVHAKPEQAVAKGEPLVILESMKMETVLSAPADASVLKIHCAAGEQVSNGQLLIELELHTDD